MPTNQLRVNIFGAEYVLKATENQDEIIKIAAYVDQKMKEIDRTQNLNSNMKLAILAALNIAEELFHAQTYQDRVFEQIDHEAKKLNRSLQDALDL
ncbi:MAG: cell division protein ZapA [Calditrichales bacterium]|nr:MAG: cell division protein ZapA [Calditrichales bacterium]